MIDPSHYPPPPSSTSSSSAQDESISPIILYAVAGVGAGIIIVVVIGIVILILRCTKSNRTGQSANDRYDKRDLRAISFFVLKKEVSINELFFSLQTEATKVI